MKGTLYVIVLTVRGSYARDFEVPIEYPDEVPDTLQWWIEEASFWRIRTFALDHDLHLYAGTPGGPYVLDFARSNTHKRYRDVIRSENEVQVEDASPDGLIRAFQREDIVPRYEISGNGYIYWKPDDADYFTRSAPDPL